MAQPVLTRFEKDVLRSRTSEDATQVLAAGAVASFYSQGATVEVGAQNILVQAPPRDLVVYDRGTIDAGEYVQIGTNPERVLWVSQVEGRRLLKVVNQTMSPISVAANERLIRLGSRPSVYADPGGTDSLGTDVVLVDGRIKVYVAEARFDYVVSGGGLISPRHHWDAKGGAGPNPTWVNARDFPDLASAVASLPASGGVVFLPAGTHLLGATLLLNRHGVTLRGEGMKTIITGPTNPTFDLVRIQASFVQLQDLVVDGNATSAAPGKSCVVLSGASVETCYLKNIQVRNASRHGLFLQNTGSTVLLNCESAGNRADGIRLERSNASALRATMVACTADGNDDAGIRIDGLAGDLVTMYGCSIRGNRGVAANACGIDIIGSGAQLIGCRLQWSAAGTPPLQLLHAADVHGLMIQGCWFEGLAEPATEKVYRAAFFESCMGAAFVGNVGVGLDQWLAVFSGGSRNVEFTNRELDFPDAPRIDAIGPEQGAQLLRLSDGTVGLFRYDHIFLPPDATTVPPGSMIWNSGNLQVSDGTFWRTVQIA